MSLSPHLAPPRRTFVVHGEPTAMQALQDLIKRDLSWQTHAPAWNERVELE